MDQAATYAAENTLNEKMLKAWQKLQSCVDQLWDEKMGYDRGFKGLKQVGCLLGCKTIFSADKNLQLFTR